MTGFVLRPGVHDGRFRPSALVDGQGEILVSPGHGAFGIQILHPGRGRVDWDPGWSWPGRVRAQWGWGRNKDCRDRWGRRGDLVPGAGSPTQPGSKPSPEGGRQEGCLIPARLSRPAAGSKEFCVGSVGAGGPSAALALACGNPPGLRLGGGAAGLGRAVGDGAHGAMAPRRLPGKNRALLPVGWDLGCRGQDLGAGPESGLSSVRFGPSSPGGAVSIVRWSALVCRSIGTRIRLVCDGFLPPDFGTDRHRPGARRSSGRRLLRSPKMGAPRGPVVAETQLGPASAGWLAKC